MDDLLQKINLLVSTTLRIFAAIPAIIGALLLFICFPEIFIASQELLHKERKLAPIAQWDLVQIHQQLDGDEEAQNYVHTNVPEYLQLVSKWYYHLLIWEKQKLTVMSHLFDSLVK